jgi:hypothetical protein
MTAVEQLYEEIKHKLSKWTIVPEKAVLKILEKGIDIERQQHQRTWDAAIEAYISRGVKERAMIDFDDYEIK